jgi:hypothetical protein
MWWVIWAFLVVVSGVYLGARTWGLWGQAKELASELAVTQRRLDEVQGELEIIAELVGSPEELAVFASPAAARKERDRAKGAARHARQRRRATTRPAWAKHVD